MGQGRDNNESKKFRIYLYPLVTETRVPKSSGWTFSLDKMVYMKKLYPRRKNVYLKDEKISRNFL